MPACSIRAPRASTKRRQSVSRRRTRGVIFVDDAHRAISGPSSDDGRPLDPAKSDLAAPESALSVTMRISVGPDGRFELGASRLASTASAAGGGSQRLCRHGVIRRRRLRSGVQLTLRPPLKLLAQLVLDGAAPPHSGRHLSFESLSAQSQAAHPSIRPQYRRLLRSNIMPGRYCSAVRCFRRIV